MSRVTQVGKYLVQVNENVGGTEGGVKVFHCDCSDNNKSLAYITICTQEISGPLQQQSFLIINKVASDHKLYKNRVQVNVSLLRF